MKLVMLFTKVHTFLLLLLRSLFIWWYGGWEGEEFRRNRINPLYFLIPLRAFYLCVPPIHIVNTPLPVGHFRHLQLGHTKHVFSVSYLCEPCGSDSTQAMTRLTKSLGPVIIDWRRREQIKEVVLMNLWSISKIGEQGAASWPRVREKPRARREWKYSRGVSTKYGSGN